MDELFNLAEKVKERESFLDFVDALASDFFEEKKVGAIRPSKPYGPGALGWENGSIDAFLDACTAFVRASTTSKSWQAGVTIWSTTAGHSVLAQCGLTNQRTCRRTVFVVEHAEKCIRFIC